MPTHFDVPTADGRTLSVNATDPDQAPDLTLIWHNGSPHSGALLPPVVEPAANRGIRVVTYSRPGYPGSTPLPERVVATAAADVAAIADALGIDRFAVAGASGGGPHALACAALLPDRVAAVVTFASPAPYSEAFDWFAGMASPDALRSARQGREARARYAEVDQFDPNVFNTADWRALDGPWGVLGRDAQAAGEGGMLGLIDDDAAFARPWEVELSAIAAPVLVVQGGDDRMIPRSHGESLVRVLPTADLWLRPRAGHVSVLEILPVTLDWLLLKSAT